MFFCRPVYWPFVGSTLVFDISILQPYAFVNITKWLCILNWVAFNGLYHSAPLYSQPNSCDISQNLTFNILCSMPLNTPGYDDAYLKLPDGLPVTVLFHRYHPTLKPFLIFFSNKIHMQNNRFSNRKHNQSVIECFVYLRRQPNLRIMSERKFLTEIFPKRKLHLNSNRHMENFKVHRLMKR